MDDTIVNPPRVEIKLAACLTARRKNSQVDAVFVKAEIYSQSMFTQMSNTLCLKPKLPSSLHLPILTALFMKPP